MAGIKTSNGIIKFVVPMTIRSNQPVFVADSLNLKRYAASMGVQRWEIETNVEPSNSSAEFLVHSILNGYSEVFDIEMPQIYRGKGLLLTGSTTGTGTAGTYSVSAGSATNLRVGDFISFSNHTKVYLITAIVGNNLTIFPRLKTTVSSSILYYGNNVTMKARYDTDSLTGITYEDGIISDPGTIKLIESL